MKISKTAVLTAGSALMMAGLGLMFVSAADKNLYVDPNNAIQHFEKVRIVPTESGDNSMADIVKKGNLFGIETDYNFALSRSGTDANQISENTMGSSILGGIVNKILGGIYNGILGGKTNKITTGNNNGILGGENNEIGGNYSVIFGGMGNEIGSGSYSAIVGGSGNKTNGSYLAVVGRNNNARGYNSVAMGSGKLNATSSFLWTDGIYSGNFTTNHVFAVLGDKGMVINATGAHDLAQLTISGSLVVYDDKNAPVCNNDTKGVLKVVDGNASNTNQKCFCSCDGSGRNSLYESSKCPEICSNETTRTGDRCGGVERDCGNNPYIYTGNAVSGACVYGELVNGTGAFLVSTEKSGGVLTNYINRSCQSSNGEVRICRDELKGEGCPNHYTGECLWREGTDTGHIVLSENKSPESTAEYWEYSITGVNNGELCKYKCDDESERDHVEKRCVPFECEGVLETGAEANNDLLPKSRGVKYIYAPTSGAACTYHCTGDYQYNTGTEKCELCPEGRVFKNGECKPVCDIDSTVKQDLEVFFISLTGSISHYTMMDRNLGASEAFNQNISSPNKKSYGCYFQWGNNYPFNAGRSGSSYTTGTLTDIENYGPDRLKGYYYNSKRHCYDGEHPMYPIKDASASIPANIRFWGGGQSDIYGKFTQIGGTDIDRQGPCPTGYHIPGGVEMENIMNDWKAISNYNESDTEAINLEKSKKMASDLLLPFAGWNGESCSINEYRGAGTLGKYFISDYYRFNNHHLHLGLTTDHDGIFLKGNGLSYGISIRCVKNDISANQKVTINANGGTKAVIAIDWETPNQGTIVTLGEPERTGYTFGGWYKDTKFTTKVDKLGTISNGGQLHAKWIAKECDVASTKVQDLELFLIGGSGDISHYMMMDRNLGATEIYNQKGKNLQNLGSYGCYFQWGNNYGFSTGAATTTGQVNPASFGPSQYSNDKFYCYTSGYNDPSLYTSINWHIWGGGWRKSNGWSNGSDGTDIDRQGPCPAGYHVPRGKEMDDLLDDWGNANSSRENKGDAFASHILMPYGTYMEVWCGWQNRTRNGGGVWLSDGYNKNGGQYIEVEIHDDGPTFRGISQTHGMQVRCVKNNLRDIPSKVSVHPDGGTEAVIAIDWESGENGKITTLGEPKKDGYDFGGWYYNESLTTEIKVGDSISNGGNIYAKWIAKECDVASTKVQDLELFMLSYTGNISHYMMMDRNLGATEVYNQNYGSSNQTSFGCYFQWGNNYPFHGTNIARTQVQANVDGYGPDNYYSRGLFFCNTDEHPINRFPKEGSDWKDLRGGITNTEISKKGPCPEGYHIPHNTEIEKLINEWESATTITGGRQLANDMLTPFAGGISPRCDEGYRNDNRAAGFWMANARSSTDNICHLSLGNFTNGEVVSCRTNSAVHSFPVRCVKNNQAAISQKITINANGGTGAVISVDWETTNQGRIVALGTPTKAGYTFGGWYKDASFKNRVYKGDTISANGHLYAKWVSNTCEITITYDPRGGTLQRSSDTQKIDCGTKVTLPSATKTGSVFVAWWDLSNGTRAGGAGDPYTGGWTDVTLFATWNEQSQPEENITIGCNIPVKWCDNTIPSVTGFDAINYKITAGSAPFPIYVYTKVNYIAWNSLDLSYEVKDGNSGRLRHIISGGKCNRQSNWDEGYKPAFAATNCAENGGSSDYAPEYASLSPGSQVTQKTVTYDGKKYKISLVCSMQSPRINSCNKNFTVTYDANGGVSVSKSTASVYYNKLVDLTPIATGQDGYKFIGWNTDKNATTALSSYTMPCDNLRLYAIYSNQCAKNFTVTYDKNGGVSVSKSTASVYYNKLVDLTPIATGQDGYKFIGWNTSSTATTALSSYTMPCDNLRLYAIYQKQNTNPIDITITCKANYETKKPSSANACVDTTLVSTTYTANQNLPVDVYIAQQEFVKGVYGSCKYQPQDEGGGVYKINSGSKTSTRVSGAVSMGRDSVQGYDGLLWHGLSSFVDSSWATKPRLDVSYNFPQTMTKEHTASNGQKYNIILQDCVPYGGTTQCVNYSQYKECTDGITGTPLTSTDSSKLKWKCGTSTCEMCNESDGYTLQNGACVKNRCEGGNELPSYNTNIYKYNPISVDGVTPWKYVAPSDSLVPCSWTCASGYSINSTKTECIKNPVCNYTNKSNLRENQTFCEEGGREVNAELKFRPDGITPYRSYQCESNGITVYCEKDTLYTEISGPEWNGDTLQDNISLHGNAASSIYGIKYNFQSASSSAQDGPEKVIGINQTNASLHSSYPGPLKFVKWNPDSYLGNINKPQFKVNGSYINASYSELGYLVVPYNNGGSKDIAIIPNNVASIYTIRFHPEGGKGTMPDQIVECGKSFTLNKNQFTNAGSEFDEWRVFTGENWGYCASNNLDYICALGDEDEIDSLDIQDDFICGSTIDLYAAWTATPVCTPSITYGAGTITANDCNTTITIADKNVGATVAGFGPTSYGKYFRRGNNVGFTLNELGGKNGGNIEEGYIKYFDRDRWDLGGTITGPCGNGYHVPSKGEWDKLYKVYYNIKNYNGGSLNIASFEEKFKLPNNGYVKKGYGDTITDNTLFYLHSSSYRTTAGVGNIEDIEENLAGKGSLTPYWAGTYGGNNYDEITAFFNATTNDAGALMPIRCFKD